MRSARRTLEMAEGAWSGYSGVRDMNGRFDTRNEKRLRGHQMTDVAGRDVLFTSQLYFDEAVTAQVLQRAADARATVAG